MAEQQLAKTENELTPLAKLTMDLNSKNWQGFIRKNITNNPMTFVNNILNIAKQNELLTKCKVDSIVFSAMKATSLNLPLDNQLGFAYVLPYKDVAQFQIGYKGFVQLAIRSGQFKTINATEVCDGEIKCINKFTGEFEFGEKKSDKVVGYMAYFKLLTGFEKYFYMSVEEMQKHAKTYSMMMKYGKGLWANEDTFGAMAKKTCLKLLLSKYAPLSIEMQKAIEFDQRVYDTEDGRFADNPQNQSTADKVDEFVEAEIVEKKEEQEQSKQGTLL